MAVPASNALPVDLIREAASPSPFGFGLQNPPNLAAALAAVKVLGNPFARQPGETRIVNQAKNTQPSVGTGSFVQLDRRPFMLTCQQWLDSDRNDITKYLYCRVNPKSVQWTFNMRVSEQKTLAGTVQHAWRQNLGVRRNTYFSEPKLSITFQSGNIMPVVPERFNNPTQKQREIKMPSGLGTFYRFVDLLGASRIVENGGDRAANVVYIMYTSRLYPSIVLAGMFDPEGFTFTDSANDPNQVEWTSSFTVYDSYPRFDNASMLINTWMTQQTSFVPDKEEEKDASKGITQQDLRDDEARKNSADEAGNDTRTFVG